MKLNLKHIIIRKETKSMKLSLIESRLFGRICYGFKRDKYGFVEIVPEQAEVVKTIFRMYREENSLEDIQKYLLSCSISSPSGKAKWSRDALNKLLNNGKYTRGIIDFEEYCEVHFLKEGNCRNPNKARVKKTYAESNERGAGVGIRSNKGEVFRACE